MRLIDADSLIKSLGIGDLPIRLTYEIESAPTVDAVPVIRCEDCKWFGVANLKDRYGQPYPVPCCRGLGNILLGITPDDYCSRAERKEE